MRSLSLDALRLGSNPPPHRLLARLGTQDPTALQHASVRVRATLRAHPPVGELGERGDEGLAWDWCSPRRRVVRAGDHRIAGCVRSKTTEPGELSLVQTCSIMLKTHFWQMFDASFRKVLVYEYIYIYWILFGLNERLRAKAFHDQRATKKGNA